MYFFGLFVTFAGNVIAHQLLACPAQPKPPATMQKMRSTYMFPSPDHPVSFPRSPVSLPRSRPASYQIIHLLNGSVHLCSQFNGLLHRHVSSIYQFVHAHTLFTHLCHVGSSPGPGDILSIRRHSCTHIPFSHTCATWAPLQVLAIYSAAKGIRARTYPFHTLVPRGLLSRSWRAWPLSAALHSTRLPLSAPTQVVTTSSTEVPAAGGGNSTAPAPWLKAGTSSLGASVPRTLHCAMPSHRSFNMSLT